MKTGKNAKEEIKVVIYNFFVVSGETETYHLRVSRLIGLLFSPLTTATLSNIGPKERKGRTKIE